MDIQKISVRNFHSYCSESIKLNDCPYATVIGKNGTGKSSLFVKAPLFALYGSKSVSTRLDDIVKYGNDTCSVGLVFSQGGEKYRVNRTYSKSGSHDIEFSKESGDEWVAVASTSSSNREIEDQIKQVVGCGLDEFVLGAIMRQGDSGKFTSATPSERTNLLVNLLGIDHIKDAYTESGRKIRSIEEKIEHTKSNIEEYEQKVETLHESQEFVESLRRQKEKISEPKDTEKIQGEINELKDCISDLDNEITEINSVKSEVHDLEKSLSELRQQKTESSSKLKNLNSKKSRLEEKISGFSDKSKKQLQESIEDLREKRDFVIDLIEKRNRTEDRITSLENKIDIKEKNRKECVNKVKSIKVKLDLDSEDFDDLSERLGSKIDDLESSVDDYETLINKIKTAQNELDSLDSRIKNKVEHLEEVRSRIDERPEEFTLEDCYSCGLLSNAVDAKEKLEQKSEWDLVQQKESKKEKIEELFGGFNTEVGDIGSAKEELSKKKEELKEFTSNKRELDSLLDNLDSISVDLEQEKDRLESAKSRLEDLESQKEKVLGSESYESADSLESIKLAVESDIEEVKENIESIESRESTKSEINEVKNSISSTKQRLESIDQKESEIVSDIEDKKESIDLSNLDSLKSQKSDLEKQISELQKELKKVREENKNIREKKNSIDQKINRNQGKIDSLEEYEPKLENSKQNLDDLQKKKVNYEYARKFLKVAPNIMVGGVVSHLEKEANSILDDIAPQFRLKISRQKETQSGSKKDKIHLVIRKGGQSIPYENLSGGQKFRIDISVRLALAKVNRGETSNRALDTLVLDEGWGSQDMEGKRSLKNTMVRLKERFSKIYVITHIQEIRDLFDSTIEVSWPSSEEGASISVH